MDFQEKLFDLLIEGSLGSKRFSRMFRSKKLNQKAKNDLLGKRAAIRHGHEYSYLSQTPNKDIRKGSHKIRNKPVAIIPGSSDKYNNRENLPLKDRLRFFKFVKNSERRSAEFHEKNRKRYEY